MFLKRSLVFNQIRRASYVQGDHVEGVRHYFYYIDHEGQLFLDDSRMKNFTSCFKEKRFLTFFYRNLRPNTTQHHPDFPYISDCGVEQNFLRCDDRPFVFTQLDEEKMQWTVGSSNQKVAFEPSELCMLPNGRLYHPSPFATYGLVKSALTLTLFPRFHFDSAGIPSSFAFQGEQIPLSNHLAKHIS